MVLVSPSQLWPQAFGQFQFLLTAQIVSITSVAVAERELLWNSVN